jgi:2-isopropylmalate synthase
MHRPTSDISSGTSPNRVIVFDTTLRDGEQSPGATLNASEKLRLARQLARLGVDVIEAGFPAASPDDLCAVREIAEQVGANGTKRADARPPVICALARAVEDDIDAAWTAIRSAVAPRIHTFVATSDIHLQHKLRMTRDEVLVQIREAVRHARSLCDDVEFSPEDASRTDRTFLGEAVEAAIQAGATTINIPDTVGCTTPDEFGALIRHLVSRACNAPGVVLSVHCHDDLGLATANTLSALRAGARQVEVTVNGIGERAGNAALEEVVMILDARQDRFGLSTGIEKMEILRTSRMVSDVTGLRVQRNKAIVGANAFAHEAGIHQDGILKHRATYEIIRPETIGLGESNLVLGKHSGRHAFRTHLADLGYELEEPTLDLAFASFKELADKKKAVVDADIEALLVDLLQSAEGGHQLVDLQVVSGRPGMPTATVRVFDPEGAEHIRAAVGAGPVDAVYRALDDVVGVRTELLEYNVHSITEGIDAQGRVTVQLRDRHGRVASGSGADTDIIIASAKAYLGALNRLATETQDRATARVQRRRS